MDRNGSDVAGTLPHEAAALAAALPDVPRWIYARSALLSGTAEVRAGRAGSALVLDPETAVLVGPPDRKLLRDTLTGRSDPPALLVHEDTSAGAHAALPGWTPRPFVVHTLPSPYPPEHTPAPGVIVSDPLDRSLLAGLPDDVRADAADAPAAAVRIVDGAPVAVCTVADRTESLWDIGIDTVEPHRRRGHATAVFRALAAAMAAKGRQPVWAAYEGDTPSLTLAARLGFRPVERMVEMTASAGTA